LQLATINITTDAWAVALKDAVGCWISAAASCGQQGPGASDRGRSDKKGGPKGSCRKEAPWPGKLLAKLATSNCRLPTD